MHIAFINPVLGGDFSAMDIAIAYLATYINQKTTHTASIIDLTFKRRIWKNYLKTEISKSKPDIIGISTNTLYMQYVTSVMREIKENLNLPIILGGHHASIYPNETILLENCDALCSGDGEIALTEYLSRLESNNSVAGIDGIWAKTEGKIIRNNIGSFNENLDILPYPDWDLWKDLDKYFYFLGMLYIIGSRGCPYRCSYCDAHGIADAVKGNYFRMRDPGGYVQEISFHWQKYKNRNLRLLQLFDPVFTINESWLEEFCGHYRNTGLAKEIKYSIFARIDNLNEDKIKLLAASGCALLRLGIESGSEYMRKTIFKKNVSDKNIKTIFELAKKYNIAITAYYILGGPGETKKSIKETIGFAKDLKAERSAFFVYKPFTEEGKKQVYELGGRIDEKRWQRADNITFGATIHTNELNPRQIENNQKLAYFFTFGKKLIAMIIKNPPLYFLRLIIYFFKGYIKYGLDISYLLVYYHIYSYDNIDK